MAAEQTEHRPPRGHQLRSRGRADPADNNEEGDVADNMYNGYCVKCKEKRDFEGTVEVSKTGMNMAKG